MPLWEVKERINRSGQKRDGWGRAGAHLSTVRIPQPRAGSRALPWRAHLDTPRAQPSTRCVQRWPEAGPQGGWWTGAQKRSLASLECLNQLNVLLAQRIAFGSAAPGHGAFAGATH